MRKSVLAAALTALAAATACAQPAPLALPPDAPKLIIAISVDQLSGDLFDEYRPHFTGGFARLASGTVFRNGYQAHAATETCPGHSTILTGSHPAHTGIVGNSWTDQSVSRSDKTVYCVEDERVPGSSMARYTVSSMHLRQPTLGDLLKRSSPQSLNVAVAGKDRSAVMMGGHQADQRWYWSGKQFVSDRPGPVPQTITRANSAVSAAIATAREPLEMTPFCQTKATPYALTPQVSVGAGRFGRAAGNLGAFRTSPEFDATVLAAAAGLVRELKLGADISPDILSIGLSATDAVGHSLGSGGSEMCLHLLTLDADLESFFQVLDRQHINYSVVLTADHGGMDIPERLRSRGVNQAVRADPNLAAAAVGKVIGDQLQLTGPVLLGDLGGDVWLDRSLSPADRARAEGAALAYYKAHPQVEKVFTARQIAKVRIPTGSPDKWSLEQRIRASFDAERSGDLYVVLKRHVSPVSRPATGFVATHGSIWDYDRRVPILFWRRGMKPADRPDPISTVNILPTLAAEIGLALSGPLDGKCLHNIDGISCPKR